APLIANLIRLLRRSVLSVSPPGSSGGLPRLRNKRNGLRCCSIQSNGICAAPRGILDASMPMVVSVNRRSSQVAQAFAGTGLDAQPRWHLARDALAIDAPVQGLRQAVGAEREQAESR